MTEIRLPKAERDLLRFAVIDRLLKRTEDALVVGLLDTKGNAKLRAHVEHLRELGLVKGVSLTEEGFARGLAEHEAVEARRLAALKARP